ncbi:MAG: 3-deoxy-manno-octulosonate cytidylyltransferase [Bacteroidetes bacterium]|nr:3-deoxy-manno-octulosonate cytidylyltransferase [Bacteroidota bacterium]
MKKIVGIIPARYDSTRFPGKPLALIAGKTMIERVYEQAKKSTSLQRVVVATDDNRIAETVRSFGGDVILTRTDHPSGTDRCAEALSKLDEHFDAVINIQGDEPFIQPGQIDLLAGALAEENVDIATLVKIIRSHDELINENIPKVVIASNGDALYFSRQPIPFMKNFKTEYWLPQHNYYKHIGIYGYQASILPRLTQLQQGVLEKIESLEQLRWLEHGFNIRTRITEFETIAVDTPEDLQRAQQYISQ